MLVVGFFFVRRQLTMPVPLLPVDLLRIPLFSLSICTSICSFCAQMLAMVSCPFSAVDDGAQRSGDRSAANAVAVSDHGDWRRWPAI